ncbi:hypothetical protein M422DRAFT_267617 [Sphaerobolus stellatus SS14]|uniref:Uncharacterized protein n=1 Tax=Sphaerobolus stellatus (strain SS14) TaxID=990650 RepID=A0A0C9UZH4_SPHS4|nr:hypothetical protein M422DRAFT_267617 [Sphaerobolus stellatus SS14]
MARLQAASALVDGSQFHSCMIEQPSSASILKLLQQEQVEGGFGPEYGEVTTRGMKGAGINCGLEVESCQILFKHQCKMDSITTDIQWNKQQDKWRKLSQVIDSWFHKLSDFMLVAAIENHARLGITDHPLIECELRIGQAHDALKKLCTQLGLKSFLVRRKQGSPGYSVTMQAETEIQIVDRHVRKWRKVYEHAWKALESLRGNQGIPTEHRVWLQIRPLLREDCVMLGDWMADQAYWRKMGERSAVEATQQGYGPKELSWIWKIELDLEGETLEGVKGIVEGWTNKAIRLEWLHAKASSEHWEEETKNN